jgi:hypothetical protein
MGIGQVLGKSCNLGFLKKGAFLWKWFMGKHSEEVPGNILIRQPSSAKESAGPTRNLTFGSTDSPMPS